MSPVMVTNPIDFVDLPLVVIQPRQANMDLFIPTIKQAKKTV